VLATWDVSFQKNEATTPRSASTIRFRPRSFARQSAPLASSSSRGDMNFNRGRSSIRQTDGAIADPARAGGRAAARPPRAAAPRWPSERRRPWRPVAERDVRATRSANDDVPAVSPPSSGSGSSSHYYLKRAESSLDASCTKAALGSDVTQRPSRGACASRRRARPRRR